jgi:hypothetical protein
LIKPFAFSFISFALSNDLKKRPRHQSVTPGPHTPPEAAQASLRKTDLSLSFETSLLASKAPAEINRLS